MSLPKCLMVILAYIPGCPTWLFWSYSGTYPGAKPGCFGHTRVYTRGAVPGCFSHTRAYTRVPYQVVSVIIGYIPGYPTWLFWSYSGLYPGAKTGCFGYTRVYTPVANRLFWSYSGIYSGAVPGCFGHARVYPVPYQVVLVILGCIPGCETRLFRSYSGIYPGTELGCFGHTRVYTRVRNQVVSVIIGYISRWQTGYFGHTRVYSPVRDQVVSAILGHIPGYPNWLFWSYSGIYVLGCGTRLFWSYSGIPGAMSGCCGHTRIYTRV